MQLDTAKHYTKWVGQLCIGFGYVTPKHLWYMKLQSNFDLPGKSSLTSFSLPTSAFVGYKEILELLNPSALDKPTNCMEICHGSPGRCIGIQTIVVCVLWETPYPVSVCLISCKTYQLKLQTLSVM